MDTFQTNIRKHNLCDMVVHIIDPVKNKKKLLCQFQLNTTGNFLHVFIILVASGIFLKLERLTFTITDRQNKKGILFNFIFFIDMKIMYMNAECL